MQFDISILSLVKFPKIFSEINTLQMPTFINIYYSYLRFLAILFADIYIFSVLWFRLYLKPLMPSIYFRHMQKPGFRMILMAGWLATPHNFHAREVKAQPKAVAKRQATHTSKYYHEDS